MNVSRFMANLVACVLVLPIGFAQALEDCSPYVAELDVRIAAAEAAGMDAAFAIDMREQIPQLCAYLDEATLRKMVESVDTMLPFLADMESMAQAAEAAESENRAAAGEAVADRETQVQAAGALPVIGRSLGGGLVDRPDPMHQFGIWDMDLYQGRARIVYHTRPDRVQFASPNWEFVTYVAQVDGLGRVSHDLIDRRQSSDQGGLVLRREKDEVIMHWQRGAEGELPALERWSISTRSRLSKVPGPRPLWPDSEMRRDDPFLSATADGNLFYIGTRPEKGSAVETTLAWFEASPDGQIISSGALARPERMSASWAVESRHGGGAALMMTGATDEQGVVSRLPGPLRREVAGRSIYATVQMEKRLFVVDGRTFWESPALERMLSWQGELSVPQGLSAGEMLRQSDAQLRVVEEATLEFGAGTTVDSLNVGLKQVEMIQPLQGGRYAALMTVTTDRGRIPPVHGQYVYVVDRDNVEAFVYLEPLAEAAELKFTVLAVSPTDQIYLVAVPNDGGQKRIYRISPSGRLEGYVTADAGQAIALEGLVADETGVWAFGRGEMKGIIGERLWAERLAFDPST
jgi:hypothetical protein